MSGNETVNRRLLLSLLCQQPTALNLTEELCHFDYVCHHEEYKEMLRALYLQQHIYDSSILPAPALQLYTYLYVSVLLLGLIGNVLTIVVIIKTPGLHTQTNQFLCNLAVSDTCLLLVGVPTDLWYIWTPFQASPCATFCLLKNIILGVCTNASTLTILGMTLEKFIAVCYPMHKNALVYSYRMRTYISLIWMVATMPAVAINSQYRHQPKYEPLCHQRMPGLAVCNVGWLLRERKIHGKRAKSTKTEDTHWRLPVRELYLVVVFFVPFCLIFYWYTRILIYLRHCVLRTPSHTTRSEAGSSTRRVLVSRRPDHAKHRARSCSNVAMQPSHSGESLSHHDDEPSPPTEDLQIPPHASSDSSSFEINIVSFEDTICEPLQLVSLGGTPATLTATSRPNVTAATGTNDVTNDVMYIHQHAAVKRTLSQQAQYVVVKMMAVVAVVFFICYLPVHLQRLANLAVDSLCDVNAPDDCPTPTLQHVWAATGVLHFLSAAINPIVYNLMGKKFRASFKRCIYRMLISRSSDDNRPPQQRQQPPARL